MKRVPYVLIVLVLICSLLAFPTYAAGSGSVSMSSASGTRGETVTLSVSLNSNPGVVAMTIVVSYDTAALELTGVSDSGVLVGAALNPSYGSPYRITWIDANTSVNNNATGTIATFTFKIRDTAAFGSSSVSLQVGSSFDVNGVANSFSASSGQVTVSCDHEYGGWQNLDANEHGRTCSKCQNVQKEAHAWNEGTTIREATCLEGGQVEYTCTTCSATKTVDTEKTNTHAYGALVDLSETQHQGTCLVCQQQVVNDHTWNSGTVTKNATCKEAGERTYTCTGCGRTRTEVIEMLTTHTYDHGCDTDCNVCGLTRTTTHDYRTTWSKNANGHWHECSVCRDRKDETAHTPGPEATETRAQTCTVCSYVIKPALSHTHKFATTWTTDDLGHWYACSGCEEKGEYAEHDFENACDPDCSVCNLVRKTEHTFELEWSSDETNHWHACSGCGLQQDESEHEPGAAATETTAQTCTICGYEIAPATGDPEATTATTEPTAETEERVKIPVTSDDATDNSSEKGFPWWIVIIVVATVVLLVGIKFTK